MIQIGGVFFFVKQVRKKIVDSNESQIGDLITYFLPVDLKRGMPLMYVFWSVEKHIHHLSRWVRRQQCKQNNLKKEMMTFPMQ